MDYVDFVADFAKRTLTNLDHVQERSETEDVYPVTQLLELASRAERASA